MEKNDDLAAIFINNEKHDIVYFSNEDEFEVHIKNHSEMFFRNCFVYDFKYTLKTNSQYSNNVKADLLIVDKTYRYWAIVEVEYYSRRKYEWLSRHVVPQMNKINSINYFLKARDIYKWVLSRNEDASLNKEKTKDLLLRNKPFFYVVLNSLPDYPKQWVTALYDCDIYVLKTYMNFLSKPVFVKESIKHSPHECRLVRADNVTNRWLIDRPSLFLKKEDKTFIAQEVVYNNKKKRTKNIVKFKLSDNPGSVAVELTRSLSASSYRLVLNNSKLEIYSSNN